MIPSGQTYYLPEDFKTSVDVLKKVLDVPVSVIHNELSKQNVIIEYNSSICIDEKMLEPFIKRFCKRTKRYFESSLADIENLTKKEYDELVQFGTAFSKSGSFVTSWRAIDKQALRESLLREIENQTNIALSERLKSDPLASAILVSRKPSCRPVIDVKTALSHYINLIDCSYTEYDVEETNLDDFERCLELDNTIFNLFIKEQPDVFIKSSLDYCKRDNKKIDIIDRRINILKYVKHNWRFHTNTYKDEEIKGKCEIQRRKTFVCARSHIYPDAGKDDNDLVLAIA